MANVGDGQDAFASLREVLAELYPGVQDAQRVGMDAGLNTARIAFDLRSINTWHNILIEASRQGRLAQLLAVAQREYGEYPPFQEAMKRAEALLDRDGTVHVSPDTEPPSTMMDPNVKTTKATSTSPCRTSPVVGASSGTCRCPPR